MSPSPVLAATTSTLPDVSVGHLLMQMVIAIAVIGGGIWLFGKFMQRRKAGLSMTGTRLGNRQSAATLQVISRTSLGKDQQLAVVAWGGRQVLVGISGQNITFLNETPGPSSSTDDGDLTAALAGMSLSAEPVAPRPMTKTSFLDSLRAATLRN